MEKQVNKIEISDEVYEVIADLKKASEMVRQFLERHFNIVNISKNAIKSIKDEHRVCLAYDYKTNKIIFDIACDWDVWGQGNIDTSQLLG